MRKTIRAAAVSWLVAGLLIAAPALAQAQASGDDMNAANNPLTPTIGANLQNLYTGRYYGLGDADGNAVLLRGTLPHKLFGAPQLVRGTLPIVTTPDSDLSGGRHSGVGDLNLFDLFLFKAGAVELGLGPQLTLPTASRDETGTGKWQAGLAGVVIAPQPWGLLGGLLTWQHSFAGDSDRPSVESATLQPFVMFNLPESVYLRSTGTWNFNLKNDDYSIPIGLGLGKIWKSGRETYNLFVEPQWTVAHAGVGQPKFQVFMGLNIQFPIGP